MIYLNTYMKYKNEKHFYLDKISKIDHLDASFRCRNGQGQRVKERTQHYICISDSNTVTI